jgi:NAD-dependent dihydropyrimidine dehydrogenase PreA subunit
MSSAARVHIFHTIGDLIDGGWDYWRVCPNGCAEAKADLSVLEARYGRDASYIQGETPIRIRCARCGASCPRGVISHR